MKIKVYNVGSETTKIKWFDENLEEIDVDERETPDIIGHRVVHGGSEFVKPTLINKFVLEELKKISPLAPLHNPVAIKQIEECLKKQAIVPNYAVFDTAYYQDLPEIAYRYPLPEEYYQKYGIRKFGFHGISHQYVASQVKERKVISLHLGAGCSVTASENKKALETTMGFTPLDGLMMMTRSGSIDPGIIEYLHRQEKLSIKEIFNDLYFESGLKGVSAVSDQFLDILLVAGLKIEDIHYRPGHSLAISDADKKRARLAIEMFVYRVRKFIAEMVAVLGGVDAIIFTGAIGYGSSLIREQILADFAIIKDAKKYVIKTREEYQIAKEILDDVSACHPERPAGVEGSLSKKVRDSSARYARSE